MSMQRWEDKDLVDSNTSERPKHTLRQVCAEWAWLGVALAAWALPMWGVPTSLHTLIR